ncbi:putative MO25-like protein At5g47540 isoform X4 [Musa acuminata AAA Group]|uniref:putative MO25-like protein At5g47540 isoform X4 n=1 Tax=Musa acuminata AAA Group TaxID=214697 RepID=UPI0031D0A307
MTYKMIYLAHDEHENNLPKNMKDLTLRIKKDHSSKSSSDDDLELLTRNFKKFIKHELKNKNELKNKKLPKKKKILKVTWDESSTSKDEEQTNKGEVANYALMALDDEELMTRHKSTVAEYLSKNYEWVIDLFLLGLEAFFLIFLIMEFNSRLLSSPNYITRRQAIKLLGDILLDRSNSAVMVRYVSSKDNLMILMNLLRESSKNIQIEAFHVFKLFVANQNKPPEITSILTTNKRKLLRLLQDLKLDKEDEQFEGDKAQVIQEIEALD